jgi:hypothetical protein
MTKSKSGKRGKQEPAARAPAAEAPREGSEQSAQREGMGNHRHSGRGNEQAIDAAADVDDLGNRIRGAANAREPGNKG